LTKNRGLGSNRLMSRRAITIIAVFLGALLIANIVVLAIWLPNRKSSAGKAVSLNVPAPSATAVAAVQPNKGSPASSQAGTPPPGIATAASDFVLERQLTSSSGNVQIRYFRNPKTKMRRIAVEDAHRPGASTVISESKHNAWVLVSPDDQWIVVDERTGTDGGGARLYHRSGDASVQYAPAEGAGPDGRALQDNVWRTYLNATHGDPNAPRRGVTIDATNWENDSRKLDLSVTYLPTPDNPDVPEPWRCTYDVASRQVEPVADQPPAGATLADVSAETQVSDEAEAPSDQGAGDQTGDNVNEAEMAEDDAYPGERFPATRLDELTVPDVNESDISDITYAINEMYARHGAEFKDKKVAKQFSEFEWYQPRPGVSTNDVKNEFSDLEKANLQVLERCRDAKIAASRRTSRPVRGQKAEDESTAEKVMRGIRTWQDLGGPMPPHP